VSRDIVVSVAAAVIPDYPGYFILLENRRLAHRDVTESMSEFLRGWMFDPALAHAFCRRYALD